MSEDDYFQRVGQALLLSVPIGFWLFFLTRFLLNKGFHVRTCLLFVISSIVLAYVSVYLLTRSLSVANVVLGACGIGLTHATLRQGNANKKSAREQEATPE